VQKPLTFLEQLRRDLLSRYDPYVRPVQNASDITVVGLQLETSIVTLVSVTLHHLHPIITILF
jgi:hypothetical protein